MMVLSYDKEGESCKGKSLILIKLSVETQHSATWKSGKKNTY